MSHRAEASARLLPAVMHARQSRQDLAPELAERYSRWWMAVAAVLGLSVGCATVAWALWGSSTDFQPAWLWMPAFLLPPLTWATPPGSDAWRRSNALRVVAVLWILCGLTGILLMLFRDVRVGTSSALLIGGGIWFLRETWPWRKTRKPRRVQSVDAP